MDVLPTYPCCMPLAAAISALGDIDMVLCAGDGVDMGDPWLLSWSPSDLAGRAEVARAMLFLASASAVALAASSTVPV